IVQVGKQIGVVNFAGLVFQLDHLPTAGAARFVVAGFLDIPGINHSGIVQRPTALDVRAVVDDPFDGAGDVAALSAGLDATDDVVVVLRLQRSLLGDGERQPIVLDPVEDQVGAAFAEAASDQSVAAPYGAAEKSDGAESEKDLSLGAPPARLRPAS